MLFIVAHSMLGIGHKCIFLKHNKEKAILKWDRERDRVWLTNHSEISLCIYSGYSLHFVYCWLYTGLQGNWSLSHETLS